MRKILLLLCCLTAVCGFSQEMEQADTVTVLRDVSNVVVTTTSNGTNIIVDGKKDDAKFYYNYSTSAGAAADTDTEWGLSLPFLANKEEPKKYNTVWMSDTYIGITHPMNGPDGLDGSVAVGIGKIVGGSYQPWRRGPVFAIGVGIHFEQYSLHGHQLFEMNGKHLGVSGLHDGVEDYSSRLLNFGVQIPFTISQKIYKNFGVAVGASLQFNTYTKATASYTLDGVEYSTEYKGLQQNAASVELIGAIGWLNDFCFTVRYNPCHLMRQGYGPQFTNLTFGVSFGF